MKSIAVKSLSGEIGCQCGVRRSPSLVVSVLRDITQAGTMSSMGPSPLSTGDGSEKKVCKLLLVGPGKCGKSSILRAFNSTDFEHDYNPTTSSDFTVRDMKVLNTDVCLQVWVSTSSFSFVVLLLSSIPSSSSHSATHPGHRW